ncbi:hypothetical protein BH20ACT8_BH20ACT8_06220 [soil metagenome]
MHETNQDLAWLQEVLDQTYARAGAHLAGIHTGPTRVAARDLVEQVTGMQVLVVATVSADGRPLTGPVDGFFYRGRWHFGTAPTAVRTRHLERSPYVSATHVRGEALVVTVHGSARRLDLAGADSGFRELLLAQYSGEWEEWGAASPYFAIEPDRMFAADMSVHTQ